MRARIVVANNGELHLISFDGDARDSDWVSKEAVGIRTIVRYGDALLVASDVSVQSFDSNLERQCEVDLPPFKAAFSDVNSLYIAANGEIVDVDGNLRVRSRIRVVDGSKDAHDLLATTTRLYALDNIVYPVFVLLVNTVNPGALELIRCEQIEAVYPHLDAQFIDRQSRVWFVLCSTVHEMGSGQYMYTFSADSGEELAEAFEVMFWGDHTHSPHQQVSRPSPGSTVSLSSKGALGFRIHGTSGELPRWVALEGPADLGRSWFLARLASGVGSLMVESMIPLVIHGDLERIICRQMSDYVCVVTDSRSPRGRRTQRLLLVDVSDVPEVVLDGPVPISADAGELVDALCW